MQGYLIGLAKVWALLAGISLIVARLNVHVAIHVIGFLLATILAIVSCNSYYRERRSKILLLSIAFIFLEFQQLMELSQSLLSLDVIVPVPLIGIEFNHLISFATVAFLTVGVLGKD